METMLATTTSQMRSIGKIGSIGKTSTHKISTRVVNINPEMAADLLKFNTRNRAVRSKVVNDYANQMKKGLWQLNGEPIIISDTNVVLDGQHRLEAILLSRTAQQMLVVTGVSSDAFRTIDTGLTRTPGDIMYINGVPNSNSMAALILREFFLSANQTIGGDRAASIRDIKLSKQEMLDRYNEAPDLYVEILRFSNRCYDKVKIMRLSEIGGYVAYLIRVKKYTREVVFEFFEQLFYDGRERHPAVQLLREKLLQFLGSQYKVLSKVRMALVIKAWNCYVTNGNMKRLTFSNVEIMPEFI